MLVEIGGLFKNNSNKNKPNKYFLVFVMLFIAVTIKSQCPTVAPTGIDGCSINAGSVELGASGSSGHFSWYDASTGGNHLDNGSIYNTPQISSTTTYYVAAAEANYVLDFDGTDDYVNLANPTALQITGDMTIEMWLYPTDFSERRNPFAKAYGGEGTITQETSGGLTYYYGTNGGNGGPYQSITSSAISKDAWTHVAIVRDLTNMKLYWYVNGSLVSQRDADYAAATSGTNPVYIGKGYVYNYQGQIDEVRIWNTARTQTQIQDNKSICLVGNETGLVAYYKLNDGPNSTIASDLTSNSLDGTLVNMDNANDWVTTDNPYYCSTCESSRTSVVATIDNSAGVDIGNDASLGCSTTSVSFDAGAGFSSYLWSTGATTQTISTSTAGSYSVKVENGSGCVDKDTVIVRDPGGSASSLTFDGTDDYVDLGNSDKFKITGDMTIEMWMYSTDTSERRNPYAKAYGGEGTITQERNSSLTYYYGTSGYNGGSYQGFSSGIIPQNEWIHVAIVRDLTNMKLYWYVNGVLKSQVNAKYASATSGNNHVFVASGYTDYFQGQIDEVRIWKTARTQTQIRDNMCKKLYGSEIGLVAYYRFDDGSGNTLTDEAKYELNGTLHNGASWTTSSVPIGDESSYVYTSNWSSVTLNHSTCSGENLTIENMSGSPDGVHIYSVNTAPNITTGIDGLGINNRYFGVFKVNDAAATYKATYDYADNPHVLNDEHLLLFKRDNNADNSWVDASATLDTLNDKLEATAQGTQFVLGTSVSSLPIELLSFNARKEKNNIELFWTTSSELNNDYFTVERSDDLKSWEELFFVEGAGNSNSIINYSETDSKPLDGVSYYRLKQTDYDGMFSYSDIVSVNFSKEEYADNGYLKLYPNPIDNNDILKIELNNISSNVLSIVLTDIYGKIYLSKIVENATDGYELSIELGNQFSKGIYIITAITIDKKYYKKLVIN